MTEPQRMSERFFDLLNMPPDNIEQVVAAYGFSKYGHRNQKRDDGVTRVFEHARGTAEIIINKLKINDDWEIIVAALLHDIIEDSFILSEHRIIVNFGELVGHWVKLLTKRPDVRYISCLQGCGYWQVLLIKLSDRLHNLRTLGNCSLEKRKRQVAETREHYIPLADLLIESLPTGQEWQGEYLKQEIEKNA